MSYIKEVEKLLSESKKMILGEIRELKVDTGISDEDILKKDFKYPFIHMQGHLNIIDIMMKKIENGISESDLKAFVRKERAKAKNYLTECDEKYANEPDESLKISAYDDNYFLSDGVNCMLNEELFKEEDIILNF